MTISVEGRGRILPAASDAPARLTFGDAEFTLAVGPESRVAAYRDVATIAVQAGSALVVLGSGAGADRFLLGGFGDRQGQVVRELRDRRLVQRLGDALVDPGSEPPELIEYEAGSEHGVAQVAYHPWGAVIAPLDERLDWIRLRRAGIALVEVDEAAGKVMISTDDPSSRVPQVVLPALGQRARLHGDRLTGLRRAALEDAGRLIGLLVPDAEYGVRQEAARTLVDGRPARPLDLPASWADVEAGVLVDPTFAASYRLLVARAGDLAASRALAMAPTQPGADEAKTWFFVPLPGNLVALELVSEGSHATYCFRVLPRATYAGGAVTPDAIAAAVREISEALVDARFLREPMALPEEQLRQPANLRYRLALRALPSLAAARRRFVARVIHRDEASWAAALDDLIAWHGAARDDDAAWPGRAAQESMVAEAASSASSDEPATTTDTPDAAGGS